jgi:hypothetical protein
VTAGERVQIEQLLELVTTWQHSDSLWKKSADERLRTIEEYVAGRTAIDEQNRRRDDVSRARLGMFLTALVGGAGLVLAAINTLHLS